MLVADASERFERGACGIGIVEIDIGDLRDSFEQIDVFVRILRAAFGGGIELEEFGPVSDGLSHPACAFERVDVVRPEFQDGLIVVERLEREVELVFIKPCEPCVS